MELQTGAARHTYVLSGIQRGGAIFAGLIFTGIGVAFIWSTSSTRNDNTAAVAFACLCLPFVALAVYMFARVFNSRLVLEGSRITVRDPFREHSAELRDIEGYRTISSRNGSYKKLILRDNQGKITISDGFATDDDFRAWLQQIPDLDARDRDATLAAIQQDTELGSTPEERLAALTTAKRVNIALIVVSIALAACLNLGPQNLHQPCAVILALIPALAFYLVRTSPLLYAFMKAKSDPRPDLAGTLMVSAFGLLFQSVRFHFITWTPLSTIAIPLAVLVIVAFFPVSRRGPGIPLPALLIALAAFAGLYSFGLVGTADALFDPTPGTPYVAPVVGKHINHGKSTTYYLTLAPWGPLTEPNDFSVSHSDYNEIQIGDGLCLALHPGRLHAPWYVQTTCPQTPQ